MEQKYDESTLKKIQPVLAPIKEAQRRPQTTKERK
jgi:hypothetical protein